MHAIIAAWLDAELYIRNGDTSCEYSRRMMAEYERPQEPPPKREETTDDAR
jgi:hypothetical protein